jgi:hypothetical protein
MRKDMHSVAGGRLLQNLLRQLVAADLNGSGGVHLRFKDCVPLVAEVVSDSIEVVNRQELEQAGKLIAESENAVGQNNRAH